LCAAVHSCTPRLCPSSRRQRRHDDDHPHRQWHFFDFKVNDAEENNTHCDYLPGVYPPTCGYINMSSGRPGGENHKGVIDFWRREKPSYQIVAAKYNATKKQQQQARD
jgi:hypothetical protein